MCQVKIYTTALLDETCLSVLLLVALWDCQGKFGIAKVIFTNSKIGMVVILLIEGLVGYL